MLLLDAVTVRRTVFEGSSKYYVNGKLVTQDNVKTLFTSIQLNVNNPQFLVLQGRITKIIKTSYQELLSLLVEAAGLSLFDIKTNEALARIRRKDDKVEEIDLMLKNDLTPRFERLKKEQSDYLRYKEIDNCLSKLDKDIKIQEYLYNRDRKANLQILIENEKIRVQNLEQKIKEFASVNLK